MTNLRVYPVCEVYDRCTNWQVNGLSSRSHNNDILGRKVSLDYADNFFNIVRCLLSLDYLPYPRKTLLHFVLALNSLFVLPMRRDTVLGSFVHCPCTDLDLERNTLRSQNRRVKRLVHIRLWCGDLILEAIWERTEHIVNESQNVVTFRNRCNNYPYGVFVIDLINTLMVQEDLLVNAVNALDSAVYLRRLGEVLRTETLCYARLDSLYELLALLLIAFENILDLEYA